MTAKKFITVEQLLDYTFCPLMYKFKHIDKNKVFLKDDGTLNFKILGPKFVRDLHVMAYYLFNYIQDGTFPSPARMKQRWSVVWGQSRTKEEIIFFTGPWADQRRQLERKGTQAILDMLDMFQDNPGKVLMVGSNYTVDIEGFKLSGTFELVRLLRENNKTITEIVDFKVEERLMSNHIRHDLEITAASYAYRKLFNKKEDRVAYHDLVTGTIYYTKRDKEDYIRLLRVIENVYKAIETNIYYPVMDERCYKCSYQEPCIRKDWYTNVNIEKQPRRSYFKRRRSRKGRSPKRSLEDKTEGDGKHTGGT